MQHKLINPFEGMEETPSTEIKTPWIKWINICGLNKAGKTSFAVELMKELKVIYHDLEQGTNQFPGMQCLRANTMEEFRANHLWAFANREKIRPDIVVIDPIDRLNDYVERWYCKENGISHVGDFEYGKGWSESREKFISFIGPCFQIAPMLITITHLNMKVLNKGHGDITYLDMNLAGKTKAWVNDTVDANFIFTRKRGDDGKTYLAASVDNSATSELSFAGARMKDAYKITTADELHKAIVDQFNTLKPPEDIGIAA